MVLGGSGYVGSEVCRALALDGAKLVFTYFKGEGRAKELELNLPGSKSLRADLHRFDESSRVVEQAASLLGGLDVLVQCAGTAGDPVLYRGRAGNGVDKFLSIDEKGYIEMMELTVKGTFAAAQAASKIMRAQGGGQILIVGSMDGVKSVPAPIHYAAAKGALRAMTQALAKELGRYGIRVNMIAPGILDGGRGALLSEELLNDYKTHCALKRLGSAREVASVVAWFAARNTYVTGQSVLLDGGL